MKNIKKTICIALLAIFAVACTNEEDFNPSSTENSINKKSLSSDYRKYSQYEPVDKYTAADIKSMVNSFNDILNNAGEIMPDYSIEDAVIMLETHFNYGVVYKLPYKQNAEEYFEPLNFIFTIPLRGTKVNGDSLKPLYFNFVNYILTQMSNKNLELSDIYVADINQTSVTFGLDMTPSIKVPYNNTLMFANKKFKALNESISIPGNISSIWSNLNSGDIERNVHMFSFNRSFDINVFTTIVPAYGYHIYDTTTAQVGDVVMYNNLRLQYITGRAVFEAYAAFNASGYTNHGYSIINYRPTVVNSLVEVDGKMRDKYDLGTGMLSLAKLQVIDISNLFMSSVTNKLDLRY